MNDLSDLISDLTGLPWSQARAMLRERGFEGDAVRVHDITPERAPRTAQQQFGWGEERVVRAQIQSASVQVTVACELKVAPAPEVEEAQEAC